MSAIAVDVDLTKGQMPIDGMGLAYWLGLKQKVFWWLVLFRAKHYTEFRIPKPGGKFRILHAPKPELKYAQTRVVDNILSNFICPKHVGAYETARGVKYTVERHAGHATLLELDIKDFFGSTTRKYVREFFLNKGWPKEPARLLADLLTVPVKRTMSVVPQGAPSSPMLCNLIANDRFDGQIIDYLQTVDSDWRYTRYSDNLIISHPKNRARSEVDAILDKVKSLVHAGGYFVHPKKVKVMRVDHPKKPQRLLGLTTNVKPNVTLQKYKLLRAQIHRGCTEGFDKVTGLPKSVTNAEQAIAHLQGLVAYYCYINPSPKMLKLKQKLETGMDVFANKDLIKS